MGNRNGQVLKARNLALQPAVRAMSLGLQPWGPVYRPDVGARKAARGGLQSGPCLWVCSPGARCIGQMFGARKAAQGGLQLGVVVTAVGSRSENGAGAVSGRPGPRHALSLNRASREFRGSRAASYSAAISPATQRNGPASCFTAIYSANGLNGHRELLATWLLLLPVLLHTLK